MKPLILVPSATHPDQGDRVFANIAYTRAVEDAGGIVLLTGRPRDPSDLDHLIALADGLLLMGGSDMNADHYGKANCVHVKDPDGARDTLELELLKRADTKGIPVLGICRGLQVMNVYAGGALFRDLADEHNGHMDDVRHSMNHVTERKILAHPITVEEGTCLAGLIGAGEHHVNSLHHQGIKHAGDGLVASASAPDGLVEAIEKKDHPFWLGTQWHPEELTRDEKWKKIFDAFIGAAMKRQDQDILSIVQPVYRHQEETPFPKENLEEARTSVS